MAFKIHGKVVEKETGKGIPNLRVKAIDNDLFFDDLLGAVTTDGNGNFEIKYDKEDFKELFFDKKPDIYLKIKNPKGEVIHTTEDKLRYGACETEKFNIKISKNKIKKEVEKMEKNVVKGRVIEERRYAIEVGCERYYVPKGCDTTKDPQLEAIVGKEVEVLLAGREILAIRISREVAKEFKIPPIITCYLMPPDIVFRPEIMEKVQPLITKSLVESKVLDKDVATQLEEWQRAQ